MPEYTFEADAADPSEAEVLGLGDAWAAALASREPEAVARLYEPDATLLATFARFVEGSNDIAEYFRDVMANDKLAIDYEERRVRMLGDTLATLSGTYSFCFLRDGGPVRVPARFTFICRKGPDGWRIVEHHSSVCPES